MNNTVNVQQLDIYQTLYTLNRNYISLKDTNLLKRALGFGVTHTQFWVLALPHTKDVMGQSLSFTFVFPLDKSIDNNSYLTGLLWGLNEINIESIFIW